MNSRSGRSGARYMLWTHRSIASSRLLRQVAGTSPALPFVQVGRRPRSATPRPPRSRSRAARVAGHGAIECSASPRPRPPLLPRGLVPHPRFSSQSCRRPGSRTTRRARRPRRAGRPPRPARSPHVRSTVASSPRGTGGRRSAPTRPRGRRRRVDARPELPGGHAREVAAGPRIASRTRRSCRGTPERRRPARRRGVRGARTALSASRRGALSPRSRRRSSR